jgi:serine/threonine protein kinase
MIGRTITHYRISSQLGVGGMGVVYAAEDIRLGRPVALKFVPEDLAEDSQTIERLRAEARAASALNHSNICTIYDVGEYEGRPFIVMELLKGQTLRDSLGSGPLKVHHVVDIGIQVADALDAAHSHGILHRDIKPANLFLVERGVVKILDFGLAKQLFKAGASSAAATTATELTTGDGVVGTVAYMSPEQVSGEQLDGRTDLFSLGVVLYECSTGHRPFTGKTSAVILSAILNQAPVAPVVFNPQIPLRLQDAINNCLEKDPELRYQDAAGLRADLKRIRRDLDSGHSNVVRVAGSSRLDGAAAPSKGPLKSGAEADLEPARRIGPLGWGIGTLVGAGVVALTSYWFWPRPSAPSAQPIVADASSSTTARSRTLDLAAAKLRAGSYREALSYAEGMLRLDPNDVEATRLRDEARTAIGQFDDAIARGNRLLASGDADGASAALNSARAIDPTAPAVAELSSRIVTFYRLQTDQARQRRDQGLPGAGPRTPSKPTASDQSSVVGPPPTARASEPPAGPPAGVPAPASPVPPPPAPPAPQLPTPSVPTTPDKVAPNPQTTAESSTSTAAAQSTRAPEPARPRVDPQSPTGTAAGTEKSAVEDDDAIRRTVETWARAIETKSLALYRSVKPNLSGDEQRRIEQGFRAVSSQRVEITSLRIEHRGQQVLVRLRRHDTFVADGREQTSDIQQTLTLVRSGSGWVISEIGR